MAVKICGVTRTEDARTAGEAGASYVGAILSPGYGRSVHAEQAARYAETASLGGGAAGGASPVRRVGVFVDPGIDEAVAAAEVASLDVVQLHGRETPAFMASLRERGDWRLWKAVRVERAHDVQRAVDTYATVADGLLFDGSSGGSSEGGTGTPFPWEALREAREGIPSDVLVIVAGGLTPENVAEAVRMLRPDVVDVSSGVESERGIKDAGKIHAFVRNALHAAGAAEGRNDGGGPGSTPP